jgi:ubiquitin-protein ligase
MFTNTHKIKKTQHDSRFYELRISIPESYPAVPPKVRFVSKIIMNCVDPNSGEIIYHKVPATKNWNRNMGIEQILISLRAEMASMENRRTRQPQEGLTF